MASPSESIHHHHSANSAVRFIHSAATNLLSVFASKTTPSRTLPTATLISSSSSSTIYVPLSYADSPFELTQSDSLSSKPAIDGVSSNSRSGFPSAVRISGLNSSGKGGGPAFVGQVFSMCDLSGTGLMAVSTHFDIPFISQRTPDWIKKMFANFTKSEKNGPVFRFFMDLGDAVSYVKKLNIPSGVVGACRLDLAYEHFKEKPHLFRFVPNEKQVKAANDILRTVPQNERRKVDGVPVFTAQNLDIAIATSDGVKWYTPYFFDKSMLDSILEESVDQHFHAMIQTRHTHRRRDVIDDNLAAEIIEESGDSLWEPLEVQEVAEEIGQNGIPLSVISKAAELELLYAVDRVLLGNRWLRKATGIQPKFPYMVDSFEKRSADSLRKASQSSTPCISEKESHDPSANVETDKGQKRHFWFPFGDWLRLPWLHDKTRRMESSLSRECIKQEIEEQRSPFLPKITMVGISTGGDIENMDTDSLKKTMEDLTSELEQPDVTTSHNNSFRNQDNRDPLFVANMGNFFPRSDSAR